MEDAVSRFSLRKQSFSYCGPSFALNIKGIPYRTEWVEYPDIAPLVKSFGLPPNSNSPIVPYTLPTIYDPRTKRAIMDSAKIAKYLDDEYPDTPAVLPKEVRAYQVSPPTQSTLDFDADVRHLR